MAKKSRSPGESRTLRNAQKNFAVDQSSIPTPVAARAVLATRDFDLLTLKLFLSVIDEGSMQGAAEREHITVSAVSRRISALESRAGLQLLERNDRGVTPTPAGAHLAAGAKQIFELLTGLSLNLGAQKTGLTGLVRVHAHMSAMTSALMRAIASFRQEFSKIEIILEERNSTEVLAAVNSKSADLGLISGTVEALGLNVFPWLNDELVAIVPVGHLLAAQESVKLAELLAYPFIAMQRGTALLTLFEQSARRVGLEFLPKAYLVNFESVRMMVEANLGVSILPRAWAAVPGRQITCLRLDEPWSLREIKLCFRNPAQLSNASRRFIDHMTRLAKNASERQI